MKGTILIVDDNREIVDSLGKLLAIEGYEILTAYDGMEALSVLEKSQPDLILLDVMMPRLNGLFGARAGTAAAIQGLRRQSPGSGAEGG